MTLRRSVFVTSLLTMTTGSPIYSQGVDLGAFFTVARTGIQEVGDPVGVGVSLTWPLHDVVGFRIEGSRITSSPRWAATVCDEYWPLYTDCREQTIENSIRGMHIAASMVVAPLRRGGWRAEGIFGVSRLHLEHEIARVETSRPVDGAPGGEGAFSASYGAAIVREGLGVDRFSARLEWHHASMSGNISPCPLDGFCPPQWNGFGVNEIRLGASWRF